MTGGFTGLQVLAALLRFKHRQQRVQLAFRPIGELSSETPNFSGAVSTPVADSVVRRADLLSGVCRAVALGRGRRHAAFRSFAPFRHPSVLLAHRDLDLATDSTRPSREAFADPAAAKVGLSNLLVELTAPKGPSERTRAAPCAEVARRYLIEHTLGSLRRRARTCASVLDWRRWQGSGRFGLVSWPRR